MIPTSIMMKSSSSFHRALFYDSSPATDKLFEDRSSQLFEVDNERSCLQLHIQTPQSGNPQDKSISNIPSKAKFRAAQNDDFDCDSISQSALPVDQSRYLWGDPPQYVGEPGLVLQEISDASALHKIAVVKSFVWKQYSCG
jgi:hypothetical protein